MSSYTAGTIFTGVRALLNDRNDKLFHDEDQLEYLKIAFQQFEQELQNAGVTVTLMVSEDITVPAGDTELTLPTSFLVPISLQEKASTDTFFSGMREVRNVEKPDRDQSNTLGIWDFRHNCINFVGSTAERLVRLEYWRTLPPPESANTTQYVQGGENSLKFRTAALCARYIGNNKERSDELNAEAALALDLLTSIYVKTNQGIRVRRKPFRLARRMYT